MNRAGYFISLIGGILAVILSVLMIAVGPVLTLGPDVQEFYDDYESDFYSMWVLMGEYNQASEFMRVDFEDYVGEYDEILEDIDAKELGKMADYYDSDAFADLADIYEEAEDYVPKLRLGVIACLVMSMIALIGAELARRYRIVGGVMVLSGAALTLIFSLIAGAIVPMAAASLLLMLGGVFQILRPSEKAEQKAARLKRKLPASTKAAFGIGYVGGILSLVFALLMLFTVPAGLVAETVEDIKDDIENEHVIAFNETALALADEDIDVMSEEAVTAFATNEVASSSQIIGDEDVYEDVVAFIYKAGASAAVSMLIVGITIVLALIALIGALICRRAPTGGGIMMLLSALLMVLAAIQTGTLIPMVIASGLLAAAGIVALAPTKPPLPAGALYAPPQGVPRQDTHAPFGEDVPFPIDAADEED